jgi:putative ATP-dependent endonuclease of OLD family
VNVGSLAFLRYSRIFLRETEPEINVPVAVITDIDIDIPEYENVGKDKVKVFEPVDPIAKKGIVRTIGRRLAVRHPINFHIVQ